MNLRRIITLLLSLAITAVFLVIALYSVDLGQVARAIASADYRLILVGAAATFTGYILRTARWQRLLAPSKAVPFAHLFPVLVVGFALNNLLPGRPGEFARAYSLGRREGLSKTLGFATVVVERVADGIALIGFLLLALVAFAPLGKELPEVAEKTALFATLLFGVALCALVLLLVREQLALTIFRRVARLGPARLAARLEKMLISFTTGLHSLRSPADMAAIGGFSLAVWACEGTSYFLFLTAFGQFPNWPERVVAAAFLMVLINLGVMIPAAPGGLGPFEAAGVFALGVFGVGDTSAASVALAAHAMQYLLITALGLFMIWREGISLAQARLPVGDED